ncbi:MAG: hypothetical protein KAH04_04290, partial [Psychrilyobacter sp.]|nr:hypothetical protein [Psychrilyobacter sp.]
TFSNEIKIYSYFGFVQSELKKFWPIVLKKSKKIHTLNFFPTFMTFEASQCLMGKTVDYYRAHGYLDQLNMSNEEISKKLLSNILDASLSNLLYTKIGEKLTKFTIENNSDLYSEMNIIINKYMEKTLEYGTFDYGTSIYLYNNFLLNDENYINNFHKNINHLLVDSGEISSIAEIDFIKKVEDNLDNIHITYNIDGPYGIYNYSKDYFSDNFFNNPDYQVNKLNSKNYKFEDFFHEFEKSIFSSHSISPLSNIFLDLENDYKSINNKKVINKVFNLLDNGVSPSDISIIVPQTDIILEFALEKISNERGFQFNNISRNEKLLDNPHAYALVISSILFYNFEKITLNFDEMKNFISIVLGLDPIRSSLLTNYISRVTKNKFSLIPIESHEIKKRIPQHNIDKYDKIKKIFGSIPKETRLDEFFDLIYIELFSTNHTEFNENLKGCRELIDSSKKFIDTLSNFDNINQIDYEFIKFLREGAKASETLVELDERLEGDYLSISTPYGYINSGRSSKYQIWTDIRNKNFIPETRNILQNSWVLSKTWTNDKFSIEDEFEVEKINTMGIVKRLIKSCSGDIYIFGSKYSSNSHNQNGLLYRTFKKINKGDIYEKN